MTAVFLASDESRWVTGDTLAVNMDNSGDRGN
jgi:hypothetical protein